jgi:amino acid adenylation domain-containing protein
MISKPKNKEKQLVTQWNQTNVDFPLDKCVHQLFEAQVERTPDAIAVVFEDSHLTYRELNHRANFVAHHLISLGVKPETLVGICIERSLEMVIGLLGILKAGGAYVPLDPSYPQERLVFMMEDAQVPVLLTQKNLLATLPKQKAEVICLDADWKTIFEKSGKEENSISGVIPNNLAYVIYTSGSTGKPKGVMLEHRGLCNLSMVQIRTFGIHSDSRILQFASLNFDASIWEIVMALIPGGTLYLGIRDTLLPGYPLLQFLQKQGITVVTLPPSVLVTLPAKQLTTLQTIIVAGEACFAKLVAQYASGRRFFNAYGPSETTVCATIAECRNADSKPPIGYPIANFQVYVLNEQMQKVPVGTEGELYIGGVGLARGYLNRPELTAEKFVPNPFSNDFDSRLYKTGDLARYLPDGNLEFVGRIDHQVKIRGFRIELEEIEAKLYQYPDISDAVVVAREDILDNKGLVAYIVVSKLPPQRVPLRSECQIKCVIADNQTHTLKEVTTFDISYGGVGLSGMFTSNLCPDKRYSVCLTMPGVSEKIWVEGNVAWHNGDRFGIQFDPTPGEKILLHKLINEFLEKRGLLKVLQNTFIEHLRYFLQESLPEYMIPSQFVMLDALPLTPNGKVDRKALPAPNVNRSDLYTDIEEKLVKIWAEVLKVERVGLHDNFLQLGGHSLLATQIISHINEELSIDLPSYCLFEAPTVAQLAERVEDMLKSSRPSRFAIEPVDRHLNIPLSFPQQQLWLLNKLIPDLPVYHEPFTIRLGGPIDIIALEKTINELLHRHESLRTTFITDGEGKPIQIISSPCSFTLQVMDLREFSEKSEREAECWRLATQEAVKPFDLSKGPLFRVTLMLLNEADHRLYWTFHHIISDGVSLYHVLFPELAAFYKAFITRQPSLLSIPAFQYADYASWQRQRLQEEVLKPQLAYWKQQLADLPILQLPTDHPRSVVQTYRGARYCLALPKKLTESLKVLSQQEGVTLFMTLLAAFKTLLYRYTGQDDIAVGTVTSGRNHSELENICGFFLNTLVLRTDLSDNPSVKQLLQKVRKVTLNAYANEDLPFEWLVKELHPERQISNPFFQVAFILEPQAPEIDLGWTFSQLDIHTGTTKFDLTMELDDRPEGIIGRIEYSTDLFDEATIIRMVGHYQILLESIVADPEQSISRLPILTAQEQQQFLYWNKSPLELCIHELFEAQVARTPHAVAVVFEDQQLTYWELNNRANQLAHYLRKLGVKSETLVGVCVERSLEMIVGILGILKAGGAYVPLEPTYPQERLNFMLKDAQIQILLTQKRLRTSDLIRKLPLIICLDSEWDDIANESDKNPLNKTTINDLAYVIYTSGSTGVPKGVAIEHRNTVALLNWAKEIFTPDQIAGVLASTSICFDLSIFELFVPLSWGGQVILVENALHLPTLSPDLKVTLVNTVPSAMNELVRINGIPNSVRVVNLAGEPLQNTLAQKIYQQETIEQVFNLYGPSEDTTYSTFALVKKGAKDLPSIGRPITNTQVYILNHHFQYVPIGVTGELYIGGAGLARGYLNRPELTKEKFISNPFSNTPNARLYKTGDLVRYLSDGNIEFLGRLDNQVKIRGFRIELGEIEATLIQHPQIQEIVVMAREDVPGDKRLIAYFVAAKQSVPSTTQLHQFLANKLPDYMIPSTFISLKNLPLTSNGKVDRNALPEPQKIQRKVNASYVAAQTQLEQTIAKVWQEVLQVENVGVQESFFELGGHSLLVVQMQEKLVKALNRQMPVAILFQYSTIQALAQYLSKPKMQPTKVIPQMRSTHSTKKLVITEKKQLRKPMPDIEIEDSIAIIGMAGRFPGANNIDEYWHNLKNGVESITFFSDEELIDAGVDPKIVKQPNYVKAKGMLDDVAGFDAAFFGFSPIEAAITDPQQRLFLECAWKALENAGYDSNTYSGKIGVYGGTSVNFYLPQNLRENPDIMEMVGEYPLIFSNEKDFLCTRVSYKLNLTGPAVTVQTACSTSLVAVIMACQSLKHFQADMALAGGSTVFLPPKAGYFYQEGMVLSPDGHCRAFDAKAAGTVDSEGVGIVVLKRLKDALADNDTVHAVIKGTGINNDGVSKMSYLAPSVEGQARAIEEAIAIANVDPETITYVEAHGTGTPLGDPIEIKALTQAFNTKRKGYCALGTVKTNIGHLDATSGISGLIKTILMLKHQLIPPTLHFETPNPEIDFVNTPFYVNTNLSKWRTYGFPRRAGVSGFGMGGTNAHLVLEEAPPIETCQESRSWQLLVLSAKTKSALETATTLLLEHLKQCRRLNLADVAYTYQVGRRAFEHRRMLVCQTIEGAIAAFSGTGKDFQSLTHIADLKKISSVVFMFSGQGAQYVNMGLELYQTELVFREQVDYCVEFLKPLLDLDLRTVLYPDVQLAGESEDLNQTALSQAALFVIEYALAQLWMSWGIQPAAMIGHSVGEYVAACLAGVFTLDDALVLVAARGRLMQSMPLGTMLAVPLAEKEIWSLLPNNLDLAAINVPSQSVVSGPTEVIEQFATQLLVESGLECKQIQTSHAFHSAMMSPILPAFREQVQKVALQVPQFPYISNVTGTWITAEEAIDPDYWTKHLRQTVHFAAGLQEILSIPQCILLEVGPGRTLSSFAKQHPDRVAEQVVLSSLPHSKDKVSESGFLLNTLGQLWLNGIKIDWLNFFAEEQRQRLPLPTYPFEHQPYWVEPVSKYQVEQLVTCQKAMAGITLGKSTQAIDEIEEIASQSWAPRNVLEQTLVEIWKKFLGVSRISIYDDFFELGGDSLMAVQLISKLSKALSTDLPAHCLLSTPTIAGLAESIEQVSSKPALPFSLVELQAGLCEKLPLFLVHPAGGHVYIYRDLARCLGVEQPVYGLQAAALDGKSEHPLQIEKRAAHFIEVLRVRQPEGPYLLGGFSFGGMIAFEMAHQLQLAGQQVALLAMIDTPRPAIPADMEADEVEILMLLVGMDKNDISISLAEIRQWESKAQLMYFLEHGKKMNKLFSETTVEQLHHWLYLFKTDLQAIQHYIPPQAHPGQIIFFRATEQHESITYAHPEEVWFKWSGEKMVVHEVSGNHYTMNYLPHVEVIANKLKESFPRV